LVLALVLLTAAPVAAEDWGGAVDHIGDGDSLVVAGVSVRLWGD
jgi:endonuclease YncB( thermonuclease family)